MNEMQAHFGIRAAYRHGVIGVLKRRETRRLEPNDSEESLSQISHRRRTSWNHMNVAHFE